MNFSDTDDQRQFADALSRLLADHHPWAHRRALASSTTHDPALWQACAELGLTRLGVPAWAGGLGVEPALLTVAARALGRSLCNTPFLSSAVMGSAALGLAQDPSAVGGLLEALSDGTRTVAYADLEATGVDWGSAPATAASCVEGAWRLDGNKWHVVHGASASHVVVTARLADPASVGLFLVRMDAPGLGRRDHHLIDDSPASELTLRHAEAVLIDVDAPGAAVGLRDRLRALGLAVACADSVGALALAHDLTLDHVRTRQQFGRTLAENQVVRHRLAEMQLQLQSALSMAMVATVALRELGEPTAVADVLRAWLVIVQQGKALSHSAIQLHGAMGMTEECAVGHCLRRLMAHEHAFGDAPTCADALADRLALADAVTA